MKNLEFTSERDIKLLKSSFPFVAGVLDTLIFPIDEKVYISVKTILNKYEIKNLQNLTYAVLYLYVIFNKYAELSLKLIKDYRNLPKEIVKLEKKLPFVKNTFILKNQQRLIEEFKETYDPEFGIQGFSNVPLKDISSFLNDFRNIGLYHLKELLQSENPNITENQIYIIVGKLVQVTPYYFKHKNGSKIEIASFTDDNLKDIVKKRLDENRTKLLNGLKNFSSLELDEDDRDIIASFFFGEIVSFDLNQENLDKRLDRLLNIPNFVSGLTSFFNKCETTNLLGNMRLLMDINIHFQTGFTSYDGEFDNIV
jgi:hypothetical protein